MPKLCFFISFWHKISRYYAKVLFLQSYEPAVQIDLLIDRADNIVNLCEIKYANMPYTITKDYEENLREKIEIFRQEVAPRKAIHLLMLTTFGIKQNLYSGMVQNEVTLDDLFGNPNETRINFEEVPKQF